MNAVSKEPEMSQNVKPSAARVAEVNPDAVESYKEMRAVLMNPSSIDKTMLEFVITAQLALLGHETAFKFHAIRLFEQNVSKEQLQHVILAGLGVTFVIPQAARVLDWIDEVHKQYAAVQ